MVRDSSGLTFKNLEFAVDPSKPLNSFQVYGSKNIKFEGLDVHGDVSVHPKDAKLGLMIRASENVTVTNSEFHHLDMGVAHLDSKGLVITDSRFHHISVDGIRGGGSSDVLIKGNHFTTFLPAPGIIRMQSSSGQRTRPRRPAISSSPRMS
jgi:polygalacturonase